jgi:hypothetical protein
MTQVIDQGPGEAAVATDLIAEVRRVLAASDEPLTLSKIRALLPAPHRAMGLEDLAESLRRQVAANVVIPYPKYRSQQERYWDRPMPVHIAYLLRVALQEEPLAWSELRRKLPAYVLGQVETMVQEVLRDQLAQGRLHRHPRAGSRGKERYGAEPPVAKDYLRAELAVLFKRMEQLGFTQTQLREGAMELLHEEEWASVPPAPQAEASGRQAAAPASAGTPTGQAPEAGEAAAAHPQQTPAGGENQPS